MDLGTDMLPALGLGMEKPHPGVMQQPPRARRERLLNWPLAARAYLFLGMMEAAAAMAAFLFVLHGAGWRYGEMLSPLDPALSAGHHRHPHRHHRDAGDERIPLPQRHGIDFQPAASSATG